MLINIGAFLSRGIQVDPTFNITICGAPHVFSCIQNIEQRGARVGSVLSVENICYDAVRSELTRKKENLSPDDYTVRVERDLLRLGFAPRLGSSAFNRPDIVQDIMDFQDVETVSPHIGPLRGHIELAEKAFHDHFNHRPDDALIVHCALGKSRSTALALQVMICMGKIHNAILPDPERLAQHLVKIRGVAIPNRLMVRYIDDHYGYNGHLLKAVVENETFQQNYAQFLTTHPANKPVDPFKHVRRLDCYQSMHEAWVSDDPQLAAALPTAHCAAMIAKYNGAPAPVG